MTDDTASGQEYTPAGTPEGRTSARASRWIDALAGGGRNTYPCPPAPPAPGRRVSERCATAGGLADGGWARRTRIGALRSPAGPPPGPGLSRWCPALRRRTANCPCRGACRRSCGSARSLRRLWLRIPHSALLRTARSPQDVGSRSARRTRLRAHGVAVGLRIRGTSDNGHRPRSRSAACAEAAGGVAGRSDAGDRGAGRRRQAAGHRRSLIDHFPAKHLLCP